MLKIVNNREEENTQRVNTGNWTSKRNKR